MFITTLRVRRARRDTLSKYLTAKQQSDVSQNREAQDKHAVIEVTAHAELVAIVEVMDLQATALWISPVAAQLTNARKLETFALASLPLMTVGEKIAGQADADATSLRGRAARARTAAGKA